MDIKIFDGRIKTSEAQHDYIMKKVGAAARRLQDSSCEVVVRLGDLNGHKGGIDKNCSIQATVPGHGPVRVEEQAADYYAAIDAAAEALKRSLAKSLDKHKTNGPR